MQGRRRAVHVVPSEILYSLVTRSPENSLGVIMNERLHRHLTYRGIILRLRLFKKRTDVYIREREYVVFFRAEMGKNFKQFGKS